MGMRVAGAEGATCPAGIHQPAIDAMPGNQIAQQIAIFGRDGAA